MKKTEKLALIRQYYPNAMTTIDGVNALIDYVEDVLDLETAHVMLADSICSDDVNSIQYPVRTHEFLGPFKMGGLAGFPFAGLTGMGALGSHVPDEGAILIYYGPHVGVSKEGVIGEISRFGQVKKSECCGAVLGALKKLEKGTIVDGEMREMDYQMSVIEQILLKQRDRILTAAIPLKEANEVFYEAIDERILQLTDQTAHKCRYIILVGAILINSDSDVGSFTATKRFEVINLVTKERQNLLADYFA
jgi:hypothetical protein